jgi:tRNA-specific 2-thiouridylase
MRMVVAMSGGVDSSVAAALLVDQGHDVVGVSMQLYDQSHGDRRFGTCCTIDDLHEARRAATAIGIPHYIMNFERQFDDHVVRNFVDEYVNGRTPIPCARCNSELKFSTLLDRARGFDADILGTGHYARIKRDDTTGRFVLRRGADPSRDQSYFLFALTQEQLARATFPVGGMVKTEVRAYARQRRLPVADKPESREICFVPDGDYAAFVTRHAGESAPAGGEILDRDRRVLGRHEGVHRYTIGQRRGLAVASPVPLYVVAIEPEARRVIVGPREAIDQHELVASNVNWIAGVAPAAPLCVQAQIRYKHGAASATVAPLEGDRAHVVFDDPQPAITPGQAVVFYEGDEVIGGGWIERSAVLAESGREQARAHVG